jgi:hypothetical protein
MVQLRDHSGRIHQRAMILVGAAGAAHSRAGGAGSHGGMRWLPLQGLTYFFSLQWDLPLPEPYSREGSFFGNGNQNQSEHFLAWANRAGEGEEGPWSRWPGLW